MYKKQGSCRHKVRDVCVVTSMNLYNTVINRFKSLTADCHHHFEHLKNCSASELKITHIRLLLNCDTSHPELKVIKFYTMIIFHSCSNFSALGLHSVYLLVPPEFSFENKQRLSQYFHFNMNS